jgi:lipopolysaccharide/colanic/teichoic acid biosynthesis glycosyltransferase
VAMASSDSLNHCGSVAAVSVQYRITKRIVDLLMSLMALTLLLPVLLVVGVAIRLTSFGPAVFRQQRIGLQGQPFMIFKFRTMSLESPTFGPKPLSFEDDRVTRLGRLLRRTSLDELPQLLNVLRGEMSIVGPRPEQPFIVERYEPWQQERLNVLPGMTGWWQVNGRKQPMHEFVEEDLFYVRNCSFRLDLRIMAKTIRAVIKGDGAV